MSRSSSRPSLRIRIASWPVATSILQALYRLTTDATTTPTTPTATSPQVGSGPGRGARPRPGGPPRPGPRGPSSRSRSSIEFIVALLLDQVQLLELGGDVRLAVHGGLVRSELSDLQLHELLVSLPHGDELAALIDDGVPGPNNDPEFIDEFGGEHLEPPKTSGTWTLAVLSSLKEPGRKLQSGWIRLATAHGTTDGKYDHSLFQWRATLVGKIFDRRNRSVDFGTDLNIGIVSLPTGEEIKVEEKDVPYPHLEVQDVGRISGRVQLYADRISGGKSAAIEVSNGFFINIRGRVLKPEDPYFGLQNLSHSVWAKFRATIRADRLHDKLSVNRETLSDSRRAPILPKRC